MAKVCLSREHPLQCQLLAPNNNCDTVQRKDAPRGNFLMLYAEYLGRHDTI